nr:MAG TPA: hypothetical protein [Caudoviricetes sp.]
MCILHFLLPFNGSQKVTLRSTISCIIIFTDSLNILLTKISL